MSELRVTVGSARVGQRVKHESGFAEGKILHVDTLLRVALPDTAVMSEPIDRWLHIIPPRPDYGSGSAGGSVAEERAQDEWDALYGHLPGAREAGTVSLLGQVTPPAEPPKASPDLAAMRSLAREANEHDSQIPALRDAYNTEEDNPEAEDIHAWIAYYDALELAVTERAALAAAVEQLADALEIELAGRRLLSKSLSADVERLTRERDEVQQMLQAQAETNVALVEDRNEERFRVASLIGAIHEAARRAGIANEIVPDGPNAIQFCRLMAEQNERMRPVVEAACAWHRAAGKDTEEVNAEELDNALDEACGAYDRATGATS